VKRIRFLAGAPTEGATAWHRTLGAAVRGCEPTERPLRLTVCVSVPAAIPDQRHAGALFEWFRDAEHMDRFDDQSSSVLEGGVDLWPPGDLVVDEVVLRGADWLERRWSDGGEKVKHVAIAQRADGLSPVEFSERWRAQAGTIGRSATEVLRIPNEARGNAYVQNHPRARVSGESAYDACNEVYFEDLDGLRRRIEWLDRALADGMQDPLVKENWFLAVREAVVIGGPVGETS